MSRQPQPETKLADHLFAVFSTWILPIVVVSLYGLSAWYLHLADGPVGTQMEAENLLDAIRNQAAFSLFGAGVSLACQAASWAYGRQRSRLYVLIGLALLYVLLWYWFGQDPTRNYAG